MVYAVKAAGGLVASWNFQGQYDDLQGPVSQGTGAAALTYEQYRSAPFKSYFMRHDQNDELNYPYQTRHRWMRGTKMHLHCHATPMSTWVAGAASKDVYWEINWCWVASFTEIPDAGVGWTTVNVVMPILKVDQFKDMKYDLLDLTPVAGAKESSICRVQIRRMGTDVLDTYNDNKVGGTGAANLAVWDFDCHFQQDKPGTVTEFPV